ncbi:hypothetical protein [Pelagibacterium luteolum]|uniref:DUF4189 domain-containing protein n=1 Tax=Pelagibacterium luteolum TaxID=440168 RepID=A0A1G7SV86_9HYPH|nr:hypothetical protein [Pelagibacterium luteolum]SDG26210.1 hypothetical protein SAMN04487974_101710 [Pelagibacterium luteolum]
MGKLGIEANPNGTHIGRSMGLALATLLALATPAAARTMTSDDALDALPDPEGYQLVISNDGLQPDAVQNLSAMLVDTIGEDHFFGAIYAFLPENSQQLSIHLRTGLHTLDAAERSALSDCEAERSPEDSECRLLGQVLPDEDIEGAPELSHEAMYAFVQSAPQMDGPIVVARSQNTTAWSMWSGEDTRQSALDECNEAVEAGGFEPDCDIIIDDAP